MVVVKDAVLLLEQTAPSTPGAGALALFADASHHASVKDSTGAVTDLMPRLTRRLVLPINGGVAPDGSGSGNNPATPEKKVSSGSQTSNTPKVTYVQLLFDASTDEHWMWQFPLPGDYASGGTIRLTFGSKGTTNNVVWKAGIVAAEPGSTDMTAAVFVAADVSAATAVPGTVGQVTETTITLTTTGLDTSGGSDMVVLFVGRDADNGSDNSASDAVLVGVVFEYTAT